MKRFPRASNTEINNIHLSIIHNVVDGGCMRLQCVPEDGSFGWERAFYNDDYGTLATVKIFAAYYIACIAGLLSK